MQPEVILPIIVGTFLFALLAGFIIIFIILYRKAQLKFKLERQEFKRAVLQAEVEIREHTLREVSRDLHDNFGQIASLIKMNLSILKPQTNHDQKHINESIDLLKTMIQDIRALSRDLAGRNLLHTGLSTLIVRDVERVKRAGHLEMTILHLSDSINLSSEKTIFVYRIFQEILNNILKHSQATEVKLSLYQKANELCLQVSDNGIGIPSDVLKSKPANLANNGLLNIRDRCRIIGAQCSIESSHNKGTFIEILVPFSNDFSKSRKS